VSVKVRLNEGKLGVKMLKLFLTRLLRWLAVKEYGLKAYPNTNGPRSCWNQATALPLALDNAIALLLRIFTYLDWYDEPDLVKNYRLLTWDQRPIVAWPPFQTDMPCGE